MFYVNLIIILYILLASIPVPSHAETWNIAKSKDGSPVYYSQDGNGYYRKISPNELTNNNLPSNYIVTDESGYYYNYQNNEGGGGHYSYDVPKEIEEYFKANGQIGYVVIFKNTKTEEKKEDKTSIAAHYPLYFDE